MPNRIVILANKNWETDPLVSVLRTDRASPSRLEFASPPQVTIPLSDGSKKTVDARLVLKSANATAELWCIQDLMDPKKSSSSSEEKARVLPYVTNNGAKPSLVVAFGTASFPDPASYNGSVVVGTSVFVHDPYSGNPNPASRWTHEAIGKLQDASRQDINGPLFAALDRDRAAIEARFLPVPINPGKPAALNHSAVYVALSNVNITNHANYVWADPEALDAVAAAEPKQAVGSVETTHGVIRLVVPSEQFVFVSGIANRLGYFNTEVAPRVYAQNFVAAHNAGVALSWMMPALLA